MLNREELIYLLSVQPDSLLDMSYTDIYNQLGNTIARMYQFKQINPHHCYDLYTHSIYTVIHINKMNIDISVKQYMLVAGLFHDTGKVDTMFIKNGVMHFYGHAKVSRRLAEPILRDMGFSDEECKIICFYIEHHDDFIGFKNDNISYKGIMKVVDRMIDKELNDYGFNVSKEYLINLMNISLADSLSQSEYVYKDGVLIDSKELKLERTNNIKDIIKGASF